MADSWPSWLNGSPDHYLVYPSVLVPGETDRSMTSKFIECSNAFPDLFRHNSGVTEGH